MINEPHHLKAELWIYPGENPWHFVTIEKPQAELIKQEYIWPRRGFGSIPVKVTVGKTNWKTSIFPYEEGSYILPVKKEVREKEGLKSGSLVEFELVLAE